MQAAAVAALVTCSAASSGGVRVELTRRRDVFVLPLNPVSEITALYVRVYKLIVQLDSSRVFVSLSLSLFVCLSQVFPDQAHSRSDNDIVCRTLQSPAVRSSEIHVLDFVGLTDRLQIDNVTSLDVCPNLV